MEWLLCIKCCSFWCTWDATYPETGHWLMQLTLCQEHMKDGIVVRGRAAIAQRLTQMADYHAVLGGGGHTIDCIKSEREPVRAGSSACLKMH